MINSEEALRVLGLFGVVEWAKFSLGPDPVDALWRPPMVVWRYSSTRHGAPALIDAAVKQFRGSEEWIFDSTARNWMILPALLHAAYASDSRLTSSEKIAHLKVDEQTFCRRANEDAQQLFRILEDSTP